MGLVARNVKNTGATVKMEAHRLSQLVNIKNNAEIE